MQGYAKNAATGANIIDFAKENSVNRRMKLWSFGMVVASLAVPAFAQNNGKQIYSSRCAMCHGQDGLANTPVAKMMNVPSFKSPAAMKHTEAELTEITEDGKGKMPEFKSKLTHAQIEQVVAYIRELQRK